MFSEISESYPQSIKRNRIKRKKFKKKRKRKTRTFSQAKVLKWKGNIKDKIVKGKNYVQIPNIEVQENNA